MDERYIRRFYDIVVVPGKIEKKSSIDDDILPENFHVYYIDWNYIKQRIALTIVESGKEYDDFVIWTQSNWVKISSYLVDQYIEKYPDKKLINILRLLNNSQYLKLLHIENKYLSDYKNKQNLSQKMVPIVKRKLDDVQYMKSWFLEWYYDNDFDVPIFTNVTDIDNPPCNENNGHKNKDNKGGRPKDPVVAEKRKQLNIDYYRLTSKKGYSKTKAISILEERYPWKKTTIEKYLKT